MISITKKIFHIIIGFITGICLLLAIVILLGMVYEKKISNYAIAKLNSKINTQIQVQSYNVSFIRKFPHATLILHNVTVKAPEQYLNYKNSHPKGDTLIFLNKIYLTINIWDIIKSNYKLSKLYFFDGKINIIEINNTLNNYNILKPDSASNNNIISLNAINFKNITIYYNNIQKKISINLKVKKLNLTGYYTPDSSNTNINSDLLVNTIKTPLQNYSFNLNIKLNTMVTNNSKTIMLSNSNILINNVLLKVKGNINKLNSYCNISINSNSYFEDLINFFPKYKNAYKPKGKVNFNISLIGNYNNPKLNATVNIKNATVNIKKLNTTLTGVNSTFTFYTQNITNPQNFVISVNPLLFKNNESEYELNSYITNKNILKYKVYVNAKQNLDNLSEILLIDSVISGKGMVNIISNFEGQYVNNINNIENLSTNINFNNASINLKKNNLIFESITGSINYNNNLIFNNLNTTIFGNTLNITGTIFNLQLLNKSDTIHLVSDINIKSNKIDILNLLHEVKFNNASKKPNKVIINKSIIVNVAVKEVPFNNLLFKNVSGTIVINPLKAYLKNLNLNEFSGNININATLDSFVNNSYRLNLISNVNNIQINEVFKGFNNFNQKILTNNNIRGKLSSTLNLSLFIDSIKKVNYNSILCKANVNIQNGELIKFEPIYKLQNFINKTDLEHVKFNKLQNNISISNSNIYIPNMDISSNAFGIKISGIHNFNNEFEYHIKVALFELLLKKKHKDRIDDDIPTEKKGESKFFPLLIKGKGSDFKVAYDTKILLNNFSEKFIEEKSTIKEIIKNEKIPVPNNENLGNKPVKKTVKKIDWHD